MTTSSNSGCSTLLATLLKRLLTLLRREAQAPSPDQYFSQDLTYIPLTALAPNSSQFTTTDLSRLPSGRFLITLIPTNETDQSLNIEAKCFDATALLNYLNTAKVNFTVFQVATNSSAPDANIQIATLFLQALTKVTGRDVTYFRAIQEAIALGVLIAKLTNDDTAPQRVVDLANQLVEGAVKQAIAARKLSTEAATRLIDTARTTYAQALQEPSLGVVGIPPQPESPDQGLAGNPLSITVMISLPKADGDKARAIYYSFDPSLSLWQPIYYAARTQSAWARVRVSRGSVALSMWKNLLEYYDYTTSGVGSSRTLSNNSAPDSADYHAVVLGEDQNGSDYRIEGTFSWG